MKRKVEDNENHFTQMKRIRIDKKRNLESDFDSSDINKRVCVESNHLYEENEKLREFLRNLLMENEKLRIEIMKLKEENDFLKSFNVKDYRVYPFA